MSVVSPYLLSSNEGGGKTIAFKNILYKVKAKEEEKTIVNGVSGEVRSGKMLCILGPSGSGKTSLVNIIAGRINTTNSGSHSVEGEVMVDGKQITPSAFRRMSGLVTQEDIFESSLTVKETLYFAAALKMCKRGDTLSNSRVDEVIAALQLQNCCDTYIGDDANPYLKGISGGEKRRLSIAMEILDPSTSILILDEPTSGLDAAAAQNVCNLLRGLADQDMTIIATLHQPRTSIMARFDQVMVLATGQAIYSGPCEEYVAYLENVLKFTIPLHESPYDLLLDALNPAIARDSKASIGLIPEDYDGDVGLKLAEILQETESKKVTTEHHHIFESSADDSESECFDVITWCKLTMLILHRTAIIKVRDPMCVGTQIFSAIIMALIFGTLYYDVYDKSTVSFSLLDAQMCIVMTVLMTVWLPYDVTLTFPLERRIFLRERKAGLYPSSAFYIARITADAPAHILSAIIMACIVWGMAGLQIHLGAFVLLMIVAILIGASMMQTIGAMSRTFEEANIYMMTIMMMSMMLGTGFIREVPVWLNWAREISVMGVLADMAMYLEFKDVDPRFGTSQSIYAEYGVLVTSPNEFRMSILVMFLVFLTCRIICFLFVKFLFTGRTVVENMRD